MERLVSGTSGGRPSRYRRSLSRRRARRQLRLTPVLPSQHRSSLLLLSSSLLSSPAKLTLSLSLLSSSDSEYQIPSSTQLVNDSNDSKSTSSDQVTIASLPSSLCRFSLLPVSASRRRGSSHLGETLSLSILFVSLLSFCSGALNAS